MTRAWAIRTGSAVVGLLAAGVMACAPPASSDRVTATGRSHAGEPHPANTPPSQEPGSAPGPREAEATRLGERLRRAAQLERSLEAAQLKLAQAQIEVEHGDLRHRQTIGRLEKEFELARRRLEVFVEMTTPARIARAELALLEAEDECRAAEEDLAAFDGAAAAAPTGGLPSEAAISRARRRVERAERERELQREELRVLQEVLLPLERMERELEAERKKHAVLEAHWENEGALLDRQMAVLRAEIELARLEYELADLRAETLPAGAPASAAPPPR